MSVTVTRWTHATPPDPATLLDELQRSGRGYSIWGNAPGDTYAAHSHSFHKHLVCLSGSIRFTLPEEGTAVDLQAGDAMDLPAGTRHAAIVGPHGVRCAEAHLPAR
jgi:quercetin dioxygenase-like cupin family protein